MSPSQNHCAKSVFSSRFQVFKTSVSININRITFKKVNFRGAWVAWSVKRPTSAQVMISQSVSSSPASGSVLTAQTGAYFGVCVSLFLCPSPVHAVSLTVSKIKKNKTLKKKIWGAWVAQSVKRPTSARSRSRGP